MTVYSRSATLLLVVMTIAIGGASGYIMSAQSEVSATKSSDQTTVTAVSQQANLAGHTQPRGKKDLTTQPPIISEPIPKVVVEEPVITDIIGGQASPSGISLYTDPTLTQQGRPIEIASQPTARWFGGWNANVRADAAQLVDAATSQGAVATLVAYNIPVRDCGSYSAGGANSSEAYRGWIRELAAGIGQRQAIVILEPDALAGMGCLATADQNTRLADIADAVNVFAAQTQAYVYIDAGNYSWQSAATMTDRLQRANVAAARGFSLNVSGFGWTTSSTEYGAQIASNLGGKSFVIDTSRNGNGPALNNEWCNPWGRALGQRPTTNTGITNLDAYLWIKVPGESDGPCNGGPSAGTWWQQYAEDLIRNT